MSNFVLIVTVLGQFLFFVISVNSSHFHNESKYYESAADHELFYSLKRFPKLFSFQTLDDDMKIDLEFAVPFISVPVKRSADAARDMTKGFVNINLSAVMLSGLIVVLGAAVGSAFSANGYSIFNGFKSSKNSKNHLFEPFKLSHKDHNGFKSEARFNEVMEGIEEMFKSQDIDLNSCVQKAICSVAKFSTEQVSKGSGSSANKIVDGLISSKVILGMIEGTAIRDAIETGASRISCDLKYKLCKYSEFIMQRILMDYLSII